MAEEISEDKKKKKKKLMVSFTSLQKNLQRACGTFKNAKEWEKFIKEKLDPILKEFEDEIPHSLSEKLKKAAKLDSDTSAGLSKACKLLRSQLGKAIVAMSPVGILAILTKAIFLGGVVLVGAAIIYLRTSTVDIVIKNNGCDSIQPPPKLPFKLPGISIPSEVITDGGQATATMPGITARVNTDATGNVRVTILGISANFIIPPGTNVSFDGTDISGKDLEFNLKDLPQHELIISCR